MNPTSRQRLAADLALAGITFIWGSTFVVVKQALDSASTVLFLALRFTLASVVLVILFRRRLAAEPDRAALARAGTAVGGLLFLGYLLQTLGLRLTTPAKSGLITGFSVVLVPVFGALLFGERPGWNVWGGVALATGGLYLLTAPAGGWDLAAGDLLTLGCAVAFGLHILLLGRYSRTVGAAALSTAQVVVAAVLSAASFGWAETPFLRWTAPLAAAIVVTALLATALAFSVQTWAQRFTPPSHVALILTLEPVFAWLTSYAVLGETLGARGGLGAGLILAGILVSEVKPFRGRVHP